MRFFVFFCLFRNHREPFLISITDAETTEHEMFIPQQHADTAWQHATQTDYDMVKWWQVSMEATATDKVIWVWQAPLFFENQLIENICGERCLDLFVTLCLHVNPCILSCCYTTQSRAIYGIARVTLRVTSEWLTLPQAALFASVNYVLCFLKFLKRTTTKNNQTTEQQNEC